MEAYKEWLGVLRWLRFGGRHRTLGDCESARKVLIRMSEGRGSVFTPAYSGPGDPVPGPPTGSVLAATALTVDDGQCSDRERSPGCGRQCRVHGNPFRALPRCLYCGAVMTQVIVVNGGSSSGKSGIVRCLQALLPDPWLALGTDTLVEAMPASLQASDGGIEFAPDGEVVVGPEFRTLEAAWIAGVAAMARAGARVIVDEVFLGGAYSQQRWQKALAELRVLWVGVRCDAAVAAGREVARGDRTIGMAASQAEVVHQGVDYDLEVDTTRAEAMECARAIAAHVK